MAARKQYDQAAELGKRIKPRRPSSRSSSRTGSGSGPPQCRGQGGTRGADRLAPDRHPVNELTVEEREKLLHLEQRLTSAWWDKTRRSVPWPMPCGCPRRPARRQQTGGYLPVSGPAGVGKTELAKALAESIYGDETPCCASTCRNMANAIPWRGCGRASGLCRLRRRRSAHREGGRKPYSVLLLDEIEKAHPDVTTSCCKCSTTVASPTARAGCGFHQHHHHRHVQPGFGHHPGRLKARGAADEEYEKTKAEVWTCCAATSGPSSSTASTRSSLPCAG